MITRAGFRSGMYVLLAAVIALLALDVVAGAQDWRAALLAEKAQNSKRISTLENAGFPLLANLKKVNADIAAHNAVPCVGAEGACAAYDQEAVHLNGEKKSISDQLTPIMEEHDKLVMQNAQIDRQLQAKVQLPHACMKSADCEVSHCCGQWDWNSGSGVCQPSC